MAAPAWTPKYPERANPRATSPITGQSYANAGVRDGVEWVDAPAASHVAAFALYDAESLSGPESAFQRKWLGNESYVYVRFRKATTQGLDTYEYTFTSGAAARVAFDKLRTSPHPGQVVHSVLEREAVRYRPVG